MNLEQAWSNLTLFIAHLKVFGCVSYAHIPK